MHWTAGFHLCSMLPPPGPPCLSAKLSVMKLPHNRPAAERASPNKAALRRCAVFSAIGILAIAAVLVPLDYGHYGQEWQRQGLLGFLRLRSVLALHAGFFAATGALF